MKADRAAWLCVGVLVGDGLQQGWLARLLVAGAFLYLLGGVLKLAGFGRELPGG